MMGPCVQQCESPTVNVVCQSLIEFYADPVLILIEKKRELIER